MYQAKQRDFPVNALCVFFFSQKRSKIILTFLSFFSVQNGSRFGASGFLYIPRGVCKDEMTYPEACLALAALNLSPYIGVSG